MTNPQATLLARCIVVRAVMREDEAEAAARRAAGVPLGGFSIAATTWRLHLRSLKWELAHMRPHERPPRTERNAHPQPSKGKHVMSTFDRSDIAAAIAP
jgi:hypothetical protein